MKQQYSIRSLFHHHFNFLLLSALALSSLVFPLLSCRSVAPAAALPPVEMSAERLELNSGRPRNDKIFDISTVTEITVSLTAAEWNLLLGYYDTYPKNEEVVRAQVSITSSGESQSFGDIGFGLRGNTSRRRPEGESGESHDPDSPVWRHAHFNLDFNSFLPDQKFLGIDKLILKWSKDDGSRVKEVYNYDLFRRFGVEAAPRASFAHLTIRVLEEDGSWTEAPYGVYSMIESVNSDYIQARVREKVFGGREGYLFKCLWPATLEYSERLENRIGIEYVSLVPSQNITYPYDLKTSKDDLEGAKAALITFIEKLNTLDDAAFAPWIADVMDVDLFLRTLAVNVAIGSWDDYWNLGSNFYLYIEKDGRVHFIPYDYDNTLGTGLPSSNLDPGTRSVINWGSTQDRPLVRRVLAIPEYLELYRSHLRALVNPANALFDPASSLARVNAWRELIKPWAIRDVTLNDLSGDKSSPRWEVDTPPSWGRVRPYRVLSGDANLEGDKPNYFMIRSAYILSTLEDDPR